MIVPVDDRGGGFSMVGIVGITSGTKILEHKG